MRSMMFKIRGSIPPIRRITTILRPNGQTVQAISGTPCHTISPTIGLIHSGVATTVLLGQNTYGNGTVTNQRPNAVLGVGPYPAHRNAGNWLNRSAFSIPLGQTFGNLGRNTVFAPGLAQIDMAISKQTPL